MSSPTKTEITRYAEKSPGVHNLGLTVLGVRVLLTPDSASEQPIAERVAESMVEDGIARADAIQADNDRLVQRVRGLERDVAVLSGEAQPRVFGEVIARVDIDGSIWLMNKPERGWSSSGFRVAGWEQLAREWPELRVWGMGEDEHGRFLRLRPVTRLFMPGGQS
jgi:hypothetical protein